ncbi:ComEC/Rec2 family competence protein [Aliarcobacter butzleri]|uniref:ComEC/Rec2 family competence protein n=1 Tax=Aliarcobacter butzleri TaxID=28197 RepID=UPI001EDC5B9A|nr:MBL fold metallo-hydrolase [Aliarcobacter butzleri]MCG3658056.1 MBL fold metallo-hydrolase [Aliarcobacter butzleri]
MKITMFDAGNGDCILIQSPNTNILIDGGTADSFDNWYLQIKDIGTIHALFITHIDNDHTNGIIKFLEKNKLEETPIQINNIYFNGIEQLFKEEYGSLIESNTREPKIDSIKACFENISGKKQIGFSEGTSLSYLLKDYDNVNSELIHKESEEKSFKIGDINIEIISPSLSSLTKLKDAWKRILSQRSVTKKILSKKHADAFETYTNSLNSQLTGTFNISKKKNSTIDEYALSEYERDSSLANETSLSFLIKCEDKAFLMLGDAHIETILDWMNNETLSINALKVSHHGSKFNIKKEFLELLDCNQYLISTNGKSHNHPDLEALSQIAKFSQKEETKIFINNKIENITDEIVDMFKTYEKSTEIIMNEKVLNL